MNQPLICMTVLSVLSLIPAKSISVNQVSFDGTSQFLTTAPDGIPFVVTEHGWNPDNLGNHRVVLEASQKGVNTFYIPWRRPDLRPETKRLILHEVGRESENDSIRILDFNNEYARIEFYAQEAGRQYYLYYLPYKKAPQWGDARYYIHNDYIAPDSSQLTFNFTEGPVVNGKVVRFESRSSFDYFTSMGLIATRQEIDSLADHYPQAMVLFAENRAFPIRLSATLPSRWVETGPVGKIEDVVAKNEYYSYQIGVWAPRKELKNISVRFSDLKNGDFIIPASNQTCFNQEGINWDGNPLTFRVDVAPRHIQSLWCGIDIPKDTPAGVYSGKAIVSAEGEKPQEINLILNVTNQILADRGDNETWRHSRLRWLNSTLGTDDKPVKPYIAMELAGKTITATDKVVTLASSGLPAQIRINDKKVLSSPIRFVVETNKGDIVLNSKSLDIRKNDEGKVSWSGNMEKKQLKFNLNATMEFDGYMRYQIEMVAVKEPVIVRNIRMEMEMTSYSSTYFMGAGLKGGYTPQTYDWQWTGPYDSFWIGNAHCGLHVELRGGAYHGPLLNDYKPTPPLSWANYGKGGVALNRNNKSEVASIAVYTGNDTLTSVKKDFEFGILITPVKPIDTKKHFSERYFHKDPADYRLAKDSLANIINIHHARKLNPVINYPWIVQEPLKQYIDSMHQIDMKVKLYYTIRELTTHAREVYALKSLKHEIFVPGQGYGLPWTCEHLIDDYRPAWFTEIENEQYDAALVVNGFSRWINYYLEGLRWMLENYKIDGIYMDDVSFDRTVLKRMRKIMEETSPGSLVDLHSNTGYSVGPENQYADFLPYIDRTWFGESYEYDKMTPDEWFIAFSSIPMGNMSEMLQDGGNPYLGMVYGATTRIYEDIPNKSPVPMWKLWQDFDIKNAQMIGYWEENPVVNTNNEQVKATAFKHNGKTLVVLGNFNTKAETVSVNIDRKQLGLSFNKNTAILPDLGYMQSSGTMDITQPIKIEPKKAIFFILE